MHLEGDVVGGYEVAKLLGQAFRYDSIVVIVVHIVPNLLFQFEMSLPIEERIYFINAMKQSSMEASIGATLTL